MSRFAWFVAGAWIVLVVIALVGFIALRDAHGFSALDPPTASERWIAETARDMAMPADAKNRTNPIANNGSGDIEMGKHLYPPAPDMRGAGTQNKTDGELFFIIQNGIRMTGMPGWGASGHEEDSWKLVRFIRHLPQLSTQEELDMQELNPRTPDELKEEQEEKDFLNGAKPNEPVPHHH
jgi:hypothetical protein